MSTRCEGVHIHSCWSAVEYTVDKRDKEGNVLVVVEHARILALEGVPDDTVIAIGHVLCKHATGINESEQKLQRCALVGHQERKAQG
jgi:hypothetical protein